MPNVIGQGVTLRGLYIEDFQWTWNISGTVTKDDEGKALSIDTTAANTLKLAVDAATIVGRLEVYENRVQEGIKIGTVSMNGGLKFLVKPNAATSPDQRPAVGDYLVGAVDGSSLGGYVRKATTVELALGTKAQWLVVEAPSDHVSVIAVKV